MRPQPFLSATGEAGGTAFVSRQETKSERPELTEARVIVSAGRGIKAPENLKLVEATFEAMNAETQLLYSSDYPHWDFDVPGQIFDLPFLDARARAACKQRR